jgi:hypothetical protein
MEQCLLKEVYYVLVKIPVGLLDKKHMEAGRPSTLSGKGIKPNFGKCSCQFW